MMDVLKVVLLTSGMIPFIHALEVVNKCKFDSAFTFIYSPREGTPAAKMEDNTPIDEKKERLARLNELINKYVNHPTRKIYPNKLS